MSNNYLMPYEPGIDCSVIVSQPFSVACIFAYSMTIILPIMLALCLMLSGTYYAQIYASIIGWCLTIRHYCAYKVKLKFTVCFGLHTFVV